MQMDLDRLCLKNEIAKFIDSGVAEDAYTVYYCYLEMFMGTYGRSKKMVELLSEFESNGSSLLMKHRDHYSHSVYVFALGLAIYETNDGFREAFNASTVFGPAAGARGGGLRSWSTGAHGAVPRHWLSLRAALRTGAFLLRGGQPEARDKDSLYLAYHNVDRCPGWTKAPRTTLTGCTASGFRLRTELLALDIGKSWGRPTD